MRSNIEQSRLSGTRQWGSRWDSIIHLLTGVYVIPQAAGNALFFDANGIDRMVVLPEEANGLLFMIMNRGAVGNLNVFTSGGAAVEDVSPGFGMIFVCSGSEWMTIGFNGFGLTILGTPQMLTAANETIGNLNTYVLINRDADMVITLPEVDNTLGIPITFVDITVTTAERTRTLVRSGGDVFAGGGTTFPLVHGNIQGAAPIGQLWPLRTVNMWGVK